MAPRRSPVALAIAGAFVGLLARDALASGVRHCELHVFGQDGTRLPSAAGSVVRAPAGARLSVVGSCVDHRAATPSKSTVALEPPELTLAIAERCREPNGGESDAELRSLTPLRSAPQHRSDFTDEAASPFAWEGELPAGRYQVLVGGEGIVLVVGDEPSQLRACPPRSPPPPPPPPPPPVVFPGVTTGITLAPEPPLETAPPPPATWDRRKGTTWQVGVGALVSKSSDADLAVGGLAVFGLHRMIQYPSPPRGEKGDLDLPSSDWTRFCVPLVACAGIGALFMPPGVLLGNELGADLRVGATPDFARATLRPVLRYAKGVLRTPSLVGFLLPEVGARAALRETGTDVVVRWSLFPLDVRLAGPFALSVDPLSGGWLFGVDGRRTSTEIGADLSLTFAP